MREEIETRNYAGNNGYYTMKDTLKNSDSITSGKSETYTIGSQYPQCTAVENY